MVMRLSLHKHWDQDLYSVYEMAFWNPFPMERYIVQPRYGGDLGLASR